MLDYKILLKKPITFKRSDADGTDVVEYYDLLSKTFVGTEYKNNTIWVVNKYYVGRPDLVSLAFYGTDEYADIICKLNGISNPFELAEDDVLVIPEISNLYSLTVGGEPSKLVEDSDVISKSTKTYQKNKKDSRSSNEQLVTEKNYVIDNTLNLIYY